MTERMEYNLSEVDQVILLVKEKNPEGHIAIDFLQAYKWFLEDPAPKIKYLTNDIVDILTRHEDAEIKALREELAEKNIVASMKYSVIEEANAQIAGMVEILNAYKKAYEPDGHDKPGDCFSAGPSTGDPIQDYVMCPGCVAKKMGDLALSSPLTRARQILKVVKDAREECKDHQTDAESAGLNCICKLCESVAALDRPEHTKQEEEGK